MKQHDLHCEVLNAFHRFSSSASIVPE